MGIGGAGIYGAGRALFEAQARFADTAARVAQGPPVEGAPTVARSEVDEVVEMRRAETQVKASAKAVQAVDESLGTLIDALA